jgi:hypothetical protein
MPQETSFWQSTALAASRLSLLCSGTSGPQIIGGTLVSRPSQESSTTAKPTSQHHRGIAHLLCQFIIT